MFRIIILISTLILTFFIANEASAAYTPWAYIAMTGSTASGTRFDVASTLFGFDATVPALETSTRFFTGAFYTQNLGWIIFATGWYQVSLDCGAQPLNNLIANCILTGTWWSENGGNIFFSSGTVVTYNRSTGLLGWKVLSYVWDIDLTGIALPLLPVQINESNIIANHNSQLTISGAWIYDAGMIPWNLRINPISSLDIRNIAGPGGIFLVDLSLVSTYDIEITDSNGSITTFSIPIKYGILSTSLTPWVYYANNFCSSFPLDTRCVDGPIRSATTITQAPGGPLLGNGTDAYIFTIKPRDTYGNRVTNGNMIIKYITTIKNIQTSILDNINYWPSIDGDAFISGILGSGLGGSVVKTIPVWVVNSSYAIASNAPSNIPNNIIKLDSVIYESGWINTPLAIVQPHLIFNAIYTASVSAVGPIIGIPHTFSTTVIKNDVTSTIIPDIISTMQIGPWLFSTWESIASLPVETCTHITFPINSLCDWSGIWLTEIATPASSSFVFTGTYSSLLPIPPLETTSLNSYIHYVLAGKDILYQTHNTTIAVASIVIQRVRIFGQSGKWLNLSSQNRLDVINKLKEKIALLSRNRTNYATVNYVVYTGNHTILDAEFAAKRTIISIGWDITIDENISNRTHPLAIIALSDNNGNGGNILIKWSVTDINSTLVAEHGITSIVSNYQLYIHGSVVSANPPQEVAATSCPYFAPGCVVSSYDLPSMRSSYVPPINASLSGAIYASPLIIRIDPRNLSDPPPAMGM